MALAGCRPAGPAPERVAAGLPRAEPTVRVGVAVDAEQVRVSSAGALELAVPGDGAAVRLPAGSVLTVSADADGRLRVRTASGAGVGDGAAVVRIAPAGEDAVLVDGRPYRGEVLLRSVTPGRVSAINVLELEEYLRGVVPLEIGARPASEIEAVKAQAVAARTYAIGHMGRREALGFDFHATTADQVYGGLGREDPVADRAVRETRGEILVYDGQPILAYYHSTCGGRTAAIDEVWERAPLPYLKAVSDATPEGGAYCEPSNRYRWEERWSGEELRRILAQTLAGGATLGRIGRIRITQRTPTGRVDTLRIEADGREHRVHGDSVRWVLRPAPDRILNSSLLLELEADEAPDGVRQLRVRGGGWGHGIGMCQWGAIGRARHGQDHRTILTTYYRGTEILRLY